MQSKNAVTMHEEPAIKQWDVENAEAQKTFSYRNSQQGAGQIMKMQSGSEESDGYYMQPVRCLPAVDVIHFSGKSEVIADLDPGQSERSCKAAAGGSSTSSGPGAGAGSHSQRSRALLTEQQAVAIYSRRLNAAADGGRSSRVLAWQYGVSPKTIRDIWSRRTWARSTAHLTAAAELTPEPLCDRGGGALVGCAAPAHDDPPLHPAGDCITRPPGRPKGSKDKRPRKRKELAGARGIGIGRDAVGWAGRDSHGGAGGVGIVGDDPRGYLECASGTVGEIADRGAFGAGWSGCDLPAALLASARGAEGGFGGGWPRRAPQRPDDLHPSDSLLPGALDQPVGWWQRQNPTEATGTLRPITAVVHGFRGGCGSSTTSTIGSDRGSSFSGGSGSGGDSSSNIFGAGGCSHNRGGSGGSGGSGVAARGRGRGRVHARPRAGRGRDKSKDTPQPVSSGGAAHGGDGHPRQQLDKTFARNLKVPPRSSVPPPGSA